VHSCKFKLSKWQEFKVSVIRAVIDIFPDKSFHHLVFYATRYPLENDGLEIDAEPLDVSIVPVLVIKGQHESALSELPQMLVVPSDVILQFTLLNIITRK